MVHCIERKVCGRLLLMSLRCCAAALKRACRRLNIKRWPRRPKDQGSPVKSEGTHEHGGVCTMGLPQLAVSSATGLSAQSSSLRFQSGVHPVLSRLHWSCAAFQLNAAAAAACNRWCTLACLHVFCKCRLDRDCCHHCAALRGDDAHASGIGAPAQHGARRGETGRHPVCCDEWSATTPAHWHCLR